MLYFQVLILNLSYTSIILNTTQYLIFKNVVMHQHLFYIFFFYFKYNSVYYSVYYSIV